MIYLELFFCTEYTHVAYKMWILLLLLLLIIIAMVINRHTDPRHKYDLPYGMKPVF